MKCIALLLLIAAGALAAGCATTNASVSPRVHVTGLAAYDGHGGLLYDDAVNTAPSSTVARR